MTTGDKEAAINYLNLCIELSTKIDFIDSDREVLYMKID